MTKLSWLAAGPRYFQIGKFNSSGRRRPSLNFLKVGKNYKIQEKKSLKIDKKKTEQKRCIYAETPGGDTGLITLNLSFILVSSIIFANCLFDNPFPNRYPSDRILKTISC